MFYSNFNYKNYFKMIDEPSVNKSTEEIDEELRKKIALYYHPLFQASLAQWIMQMQTQNYSTLTMQQYSDLNIRIQKSLILDFDFDAAAASAFEDWKIDVEREKFDKEFEEKQKNSKNESPQKDRDYAKETLDYERLSEFFFDLCLSWCQHLDIETFLFFLNGVFLNITSGTHISVSSFKNIDKINVLSINFFNTLLRYRTECEERQHQDYKSWYNWNFKRINDIVKNVEAHLSTIFDPEDKRAFDIWMDIPQSTGNSYIDSHIKKLDKQLLHMSKINEKADTMTKTITKIDNIKRMSANDEQFGFQRPKETDIESYQPIQKDTTIRKPIEEKSQNYKKQNKFEKQVIATLPQQYNYARLIEITESSYLIRNEVRLPIFGKSIQMNERKRVKRESSNLMQNLNWKKGTRPSTHSIMKAADKDKPYYKSKENIDIKSDHVDDEYNETEIIGQEGKIHRDRDDESIGRIDVKVPRPGDMNYDKIQDQNQAIKKLILGIDHMINNYNQKNEEAKGVDDIEELIRHEIDKELLLSLNEKKTIEVLVIDYFRNGKSVLDLIRLDKLEEDLKSHEYEEDKQSQEDSEERENTDLLWKLPESDQYYELLTQKVPNKYERINEIKYKIPMKWTKKFNVDDIVPHKEKLQSAIVSEGGLVNNYIKMKRKLMAKKGKNKISDRLSESVHPATSHLQAEIGKELTTPQDTNFNKISDSKDITTKEKNFTNFEDDAKSSAKFNETDGFNQMRKKPIFVNQPDGQNVPLSNTMLKESLSSKQDSPRMQTSQGIAFPKPGQSEESKTLLQKQKQHIVTDDSTYLKDKINIEEQSPNIIQESPDSKQESRFDHKRDYEGDEKANLTDHEVIAERTRAMNFDYDQNQPESPRTDANYDDQRADLLSRENRFDYAQIKPLYKPPKYNIEEIGHLFMDGKIPDEIYNIEDPMEYNYLLVKLK